MTSITVRLQYMAKTPLGSTQCHYVSAGGDERVTTVDEVHMASVVAGHPVRPIRSFAGQKHYPGLFWSVTTGAHLKYESLLERDRFLLVTSVSVGAGGQRSGYFAKLTPISYQDRPLAMECRCPLPVHANPISAEPQSHRSTAETHS
jgi:hypothetical protein